MFQFVSFLERLSNVLNVDDISKDVGDEYRTDALLVRAEQLARLESDKIVDKVRWLITDGSFFPDSFPSISLS